MLKSQLKVVRDFKSILIFEILIILIYLLHLILMLFMMVYYLIMKNFDENNYFILYH